MPGAISTTEEILGKALDGGRRDDVVLATEVGFPLGGDPNGRGARAGGSFGRGFDGVHIEQN